MNRRSFLATLAAGAVALTDPERLIWTPTKKIFIPAAPKLYRIPDDGLSIRMIRSFDRQKNIWITRFDAVSLAEGEIRREALQEVRFIDGPLWPIETISREKFLELYPNV